jgi:hypothetical protein
MPEEQPPSQSKSWLLDLSQLHAEIFEDGRIQLILDFNFASDRPFPIILMDDAQVVEEQL